MFPVILSWPSTMYRVQGSTVEYALVYLGSALEGLTEKKPWNREVLAKRERLSSVA